MKEASGELSMVVITLIIVVAVFAIWRIAKPMVQNWVVDKFNDTTSDNMNVNY